MAIQRARRIFIESGLTDNITTAFQIYQEILAERDRELTITREMAPEEYGGFVIREDDLFDCPNCGDKMYIRFFTNPGEGEAKSQVVCRNDKCDTIYDSDKTASEWIQYFKEERQKREKNAVS